MYQGRVSSGWGECGRMGQGVPVEGGTRRDPAVPTPGD